MPHRTDLRDARAPRRRRTPLVLAAAGLLGATLALSGCAGAGGTGPAEITFHMSKPEAIPYFRDLVTKFNAEQDDVRVTLDTASNLSAGFLRGNPPDVGLLNYNYEMARFMERGALSDLSDMPEADRIRPEVQELVDQYATYPGRTSSSQTPITVDRVRPVAVITSVAVTASARHTWSSTRRALTLRSTWGDVAAPISSIRLTPPSPSVIIYDKQ